MRVTIYLDDEVAEELEGFADEEHRTVRQQATVLILKALESRRQARLQRDIVAA